MNDFGARLKNARLGVKDLSGNPMTQHALSQRSGIAVTRISDYECGRRTPGLAALVKLSEALQLCPNELYALVRGEEW